MRSILSFVLVFLHTTQSSVRMQTPHLRAQRKTEITMPRYDRECDAILSVMPLPSRVAILKVKGFCEGRFAFMNSMHKIHQTRLMIRRTSTSTPLSANDPNHTIAGNQSMNATADLLVLDVDETILDQSSYYVTPSQYQKARNVSF